MMYTVQCEWDPYGVWVTTCPEVPNAVTQSKRLDLVPGDAAELLSLATGDEVTVDDIVVEWSAPDDMESTARVARQLREDAARAQDAATAETISAVRQLHDRGLSVRDVGTMVGVSHQYVAKVVKHHGRQPA